MLLSLSDIHENMTVMLDEKICKVISNEMHGTGQTGRIFLLRAKSVSDGHIIEKRMRAEEKIPEIKLDRIDLEFTYKDNDFYYFYDPASFDQIPISNNIVGDLAPFLKENAKIQVEYYEGNPVNVMFPQSADLAVASCAPGTREQDSTMKEAVLENGITVHVPQFIKEGDIVRIDVAKRKYLERKKDEKK